MRLRRRLLLALLCLPWCAGAGGCSRVEKVRVTNGYAVPVRIRLNGQATTPVLAARGEAVLDGRHYIGGGGVRVTVLDPEGRELFDAVLVPPGDSAFRREARIEVGR